MWGGEEVGIGRTDRPQTLGGGGVCWTLRYVGTWQERGGHGVRGGSGTEVSAFGELKGPGRSGAQRMQPHQPLLFYLQGQETLERNLEATRAPDSVRAAQALRRAASRTSAPFPPPQASRHPLEVGWEQGPGGEGILPSGSG